MKRLFLTVTLCFAASMMAQTAKPGTTVPQGAAIPGIGAPEGPNGPGYIEFGGSRSDLTSPTALPPISSSMLTSAPAWAASSCPKFVSMDS
jgi:hypothetical protein